MKIFFLIFIALGVKSICFSRENKTDKNDLEYSFIDGVKNEQFGNFENAAYLFKTCIVYDSTCGACYYELSRIYRTVGDFINALNYSIKAFNIDKENYWYLKNIIEIEILKHDYKGAIRNLKIMINSGIAKIDDQVNYAKVLILANEGDKAIKLLNKIENKYGISENISMIKYRYYLNKKNFKDAEVEVNKLIINDNENVVLLGTMAELYAIQGKEKEALKFYMKLLKIDNINIAGLTSLGRFYSSKKDTINAKSAFNLIFLNEKISFDIKVEALNDFIKNSNDSFILKSYLKNLIKVFVDKYPDSIQLMESYIAYFDEIKDYNSAYLTCKKLVGFKPENVSYWERTFYYENILKKYDEIINIIDTSENKFSGNPFIMLIGGIAYYQNNNFLKAIDLLEKGYGLKTENEFLNEQYLIFLSEANYKLGRRDSAFYYFEIATSGEKKDVGLMNNYAYYLAECDENLEKALNLSFYTIQKEPKNATFLDTYAWILFKQKMYKSALKYIKLAYKYNKEKSFEIVVHFGDIYYCNGQISYAKEKWNESLKLGADSLIINKKLNEFKCE